MFVGKVSSWDNSENVGVEGDGKHHKITTAPCTLWYETWHSNMEGLLSGL